MAALWDAPGRIGQTPIFQTQGSSRVHGDPLPESLQPKAGAHSPRSDPPMQLTATSTYTALGYNGTESTTFTLFTYNLLFITMENALVKCLMGFKCIL